MRYLRCIYQVTPAATPHPSHFVCHLPLKGKALFFYSMRRRHLIVCKANISPA